MTLLQCIYNGLTTAGIAINLSSSSIKEGGISRLILIPHEYSVDVNAVSGTAKLGEFTYCVQAYVLGKRDN